MTPDEKSGHEYRHWGKRKKNRPAVIRPICCSLGFVTLESFGIDKYRLRICDKQALDALICNICEIEEIDDVGDFKQHVYKSLADLKGAKRFYEVNRNACNLKVRN